MEINFYICIFKTVALVDCFEYSKIILGYDNRKTFNIGNNKVYIKSALNVDTPEKKAQETMSLRNTGDFYRRIIIVDGNRKPWIDDGITYIGVIPFLLATSISN